VNSPTQNGRDWLRIWLIFLAVTYAFFAGLRTVSDFDLGWQLATGRYVVEQHHIPRTELFSYTTQGKEWIYPPFSGAIFYLLYLASGYSALSWLGAMACAATVAFLCNAGGRLTAVLAFIAVPAIAFRTIPRAELFTTVLFAMVLAAIWRHHQGKSVRLWVLPAVFFLWVNLHLGFIAGLGVLGAGILFELCDMIFADRRAGAFARLKQVAIWLAASIAATLANPWGWRIYEAIYRQNKVMQVHSAFISEWSAVQFNSLTWRQALSPRDPASADWWLLAAGLGAIFVATWKRRFGPAIVLAAGMYLSVQHIRLQALFAVVVVVIGGGLLSPFARTLTTAEVQRPKDPENSARMILSGRIFHALVFVSAVVLGFLGIVRITDLISNHYYLDSDQISLFGTGPSWWYPERAAAFLERERLPGNIFHDYGQGGYLAWRLGPKYPVFVDGRYIPFGKELFAEQKQLMSALPDSAEWKEAADRWKINTLIFPVARYAGLGTFPFQDYCESKEWKLVYVDDVSVLFVRNRPENSDVLRKFAQSCGTVAIASPPMTPASSYRARAERFNFFMNAGSIFYFLSRDKEAASALDQAEQLFPDNANLHLVKAQFLGATNRPGEAEREYLRTVRTSPSDAAWYALARLYVAKHQYADALRCLKEAAPLSQVPFDRLRAQGVVYVYMNQPQEALAAFQRAEAKSPYRGDSSDLGKQFNAQLAEGRARAYRELNDLDHAVSQQELAVRLSPEKAAWWTTLADLYQAQGQTEKALHARERAESLQKNIGSSTGPAKPGGSQ
jgi:tetratricopeptide (TPR) repeat protein